MIFGKDKTDRTVMIANACKEFYSHPINDPPRNEAERIEQERLLDDDPKHIEHYGIRNLIHALRRYIKRDQELLK